MIYTPVNDNTPVLVNNTITLDEGDTLAISADHFSATDADIPADTLTFTVSAVTGGQFELTSDTGVAVTSFTAANVTAGIVQFVDDGNEDAPSFSTKVGDGTTDSAVAAATVIYTPVNDAPVGVADTAATHASLTIDEGATAAIINVLDNDTDAESGTLSVVYVDDDDANIAGNQTTEGGEVTLTDGVITYTPLTNFNGTDTFQYKVYDGTDQAATLTTATVTVKQVNDAHTGSIVITGTTTNGETLTATIGDLADIDSPVSEGAITFDSYQWAKDGTNINGATNSTLVLGDSDVGSIFTVTADYTDGDNNVESSTSSATSAITDIVQVVQIRNITTTGSVDSFVNPATGLTTYYYASDSTDLTAMDVSIISDTSNIDRSGGSTEVVVKFELWIDAGGIDDLDATYSFISGIEYDIDFLQSATDTAVLYSSDDPDTWDDTDDSTTNDTRYMEIIEYGIETGNFTYLDNDITGEGTMADPSAMIDIDNNSDTKLEFKIADVYIKPTDINTSYSITINQAANFGSGVIDLDSYSVDIL